MPRKRRLTWTTVSIPEYVKKKLASYGDFGESWADLLLRLLEDVEESKKIKERYGLKSTTHD